MKDSDLRYFDDSKPVCQCDIAQCEMCQHFKGKRSCAAFDQIPDAIWDNKFDHRQPHAGDKGIRFEWRHDIRPPAGA